ncbi:MAG: UbiA family prenyltransferase [Candidatus Omnitrophica bacterium]|nr:UbiA family prenyltransferase [Candidatus Omnitrophota bacterium]
MNKSGIKYYIAIARPKDWFKNFFMIPGTIIAAVFSKVPLSSFWFVLIIGFMSTCLISSANYVLNEWLDSDSDKYHPIKKSRPSVTGNLNPFWVYAEYIIFSVVGILLARMVSLRFLLASVLFIIMGILYNVKPFRTKDIAFLDVITESFDNPIRLILGWTVVTSNSLPFLSLLLIYWTGGAFLMNVKRYSEFRFIKNHDLAVAYRKSFKYYNQKRLLISTFLYANFACFFIGIFLVKYRIELLLSLPAIAILFTWYFYLSFKPNSATQRPEYLLRERLFMFYVFLVIILIILLMFVNIPALHYFLYNEFIPTR